MSKRPDPRKYRPTWGGHMEPVRKGWKKLIPSGCLPQMLLLLASTALIGFGVTLIETQLGGRHGQGKAGADHYDMELRNSAQILEAVSEAEADKAGGEGQ